MKGDDQEDDQVKTKMAKATVMGTNQECWVNSWFPFWNVQSSKVKDVFQGSLKGVQMAGKMSLNLWFWSLRR